MTCHRFPNVVVKAVGDSVTLTITAPADWPVVGTGLTDFAARGGVYAKDNPDVELLALVPTIVGQVITITLTGDVPGDEATGQTRMLGIGEFLIGVRVIDDPLVIAAAEIELHLTRFASK